MGKFYTKLRNKKASNLFVFEGTHNNPGFIERVRTNAKEKTINESSLSRIWQLTQKHKSATISAFRSAKDCNRGEAYSKKENLKNSKILKAKLLKAGFSVTKIAGTYIENYKSDNQIEVKEESYIAINIKNSKNFKNAIIALGLAFEQDRVTYQEKDGIYYLISTNKCEEGYPGFGEIGKEVKLGKSIFGKDGEFYSKINGRPFVFESLDTKTDTLTSKSIAEIRSFVEFSKLSKL